MALNNYPRWDLIAKSSLGWSQDESGKSKHIGGHHSPVWYLCEFWFVFDCKTKTRGPVLTKKYNTLGCPIPNLPSTEAYLHMRNIINRSQISQLRQRPNLNLDSNMLKCLFEQVKTRRACCFPKMLKNYEDNEMIGGQWLSMVINGKLEKSTRLQYGLWYIEWASWETSTQSLHSHLSILFWWREAQRSVIVLLWLCVMLGAV